MTEPMTEPDGMTIRGLSGAQLVVERFEDGTVGMWIAPPGEFDGCGVGLTEGERRRVAAFLLAGLE